MREESSFLSNLLMGNVRGTFRDRVAKHLGRLADAPHICRDLVPNIGPFTPKIARPHH